MDSGPRRIPGKFVLVRELCRRRRYATRYGFMDVTTTLGRVAEIWRSFGEVTWAYVRVFVIFLCVDCDQTSLYAGVGPCCPIVATRVNTHIHTICFCRVIVPSASYWSKRRSDGGSQYILTCWNGEVWCEVGRVSGCGVSFEIRLRFTLHTILF